MPLSWWRRNVRERAPRRRDETAPDDCLVTFALTPDRARRPVVRAAVTPSEGLVLVGAGGEDAAVGAALKAAEQAARTAGPRLPRKPAPVPRTVPAARQESTPDQVRAEIAALRAAVAVAEQDDAGTVQVVDALSAWEQESLSVWEQDGPSGRAPVEPVAGPAVEPVVETAAETAAEAAAEAAAETAAETAAVPAGAPAANGRKVPARKGSKTRGRTTVRPARPAEPVAAPAGTTSGTTAGTTTVAAAAADVAETDRADDDAPSATVVDLRPADAQRAS